MSNYLSVSEYAKIHGKDPGNIRRLLATGRLIGQKVGSQLIIPENAVYPSDKRVTTGKYQNREKRIALNKHKDLMKTISALVPDLCTIYGELAYEIILYGSYARGTQTEESDVDIAVIVLDKPDNKITDAMVDCVSSHELECGKVLSVIDIKLETFNQWKDILPFYKNIMKEGIVLWKTAA